MYVCMHLSSHDADLSTLIDIQYNQIPYSSCFPPERYKFRGRRLHQQIETLPENKIHGGNKEQHRNKQRGKKKRKERKEKKRKGGKRYQTNEGSGGKKPKRRIRQTEREKGRNKGK